MRDKLEGGPHSKTKENECNVLVLLHSGTKFQKKLVKPK